MQYTKTHEVSFSFEEPDKILDALRLLFQEIHVHARAKAVAPTPLHAHTILLLDSNSTRANAIAYLLSSAGYYPFIATNALEAFTLFLRGAFVPFVILLGQEDTNKRFFLSRLLQQVTQKYQWDTPLIKVYTQNPTIAAPDTEKLSPNKRALFEVSSISEGMHSSLSTQTTAPLPRVPETPRQLPSEVERVAQMPFPPEQYSPQPTSVIPYEAVINISTHDIQHEPGIAAKISLEGLSIGRYHMKTFLGSGPLGQVYQTYDRLREQDVALKAIQMNVLPPTMSENISTETNFFQKEIDLLRMLDHPHILLPLNCGKSYISGSPFIYKTMPYLADGSIAELLAQSGMSKPLSPQQVVAIVVQIAETLQHAHSHNITYQNFKLSNFLVQMQGKKRNIIHIFLTDFAIAQKETFLVKEPAVFPYMAPECWYGQSLLASDQYGLAAITYELLTGRVLFQGQSEQIMRQLHLYMQPQPLMLFAPHLSPRLSNVVLRALSKKVEDRFPSIIDFAHALQQESA